MTQEEIEKLARDFLNSLTPREYLFATTNPRFIKSPTSNISQGEKFEEREYDDLMNSVTKKHLIMLEIIAQKCSDEKEDNEIQYMENVDNEIERILKRESIIDTRVETKRLDSPSQKRLS